MKGNFWKLCGTCGEIISSDDFDEFLKLLTEHVCNKVAG